MSMMPPSNSWGELRRIPLLRTWVNSSVDFAQLVRGALTPQLSREALNVIHAPRLRYLASFEAAEEHLAPRDPLARGFDAHEGSHVRRVHRRPQRYLVAFGHHRMDLHLPVGEHRPHALELLLCGLGAGGP